MKGAELSHRMLAFINEHHVLSMATFREERLSSCSLFYLFIEEEMCFLFASDEATEHMRNIRQNPFVSASIHNETSEVKAIKGLQIRGRVERGTQQHEELYLRRYPYAKEVKHKSIWQLKITALKYTDNTLGFGKKEVWNY